MEHIVIFLTAIVVSFVASIPIGAVNMAVFQATINHNRKAGYTIGIGAILAEAIYCGIPLFGLSYLLEDVGFYDVMYLIFIPVMVFLGIYSIRYANKGLERELKMEQTPRRKSYLGYGIYGFLLCGSNPMTLVFWTQITVYLRQQEIIAQNPWELLTFLCGVPVGTFCLYFIFVQIAHRTRKNMNPRWKRRINIIIGWIFIGLAVYLLISYFKRMGIL